MAFTPLDLALGDLGVNIHRFSLGSHWYCKWAKSRRIIMYRCSILILREGFVGKKPVPSTPFSVKTGSINWAPGAFNFLNSHVKMKLFPIILILLSNALAFNLGPCSLLGPLNTCLPYRKSFSISTTPHSASIPSSSSTLSRSSSVSESPGHQQPSVTPRSSLSTRVIVVTSTTTVWESA